MIQKMISAVRKTFFQVTYNQQKRKFLSTRLKVLQSNSQAHCVFLGFFGRKFYFLFWKSCLNILKMSEKKVYFPLRRLRNYQDAFTVKWISAFALSLLDYFSVVYISELVRI